MSDKIDEHLNSLMAMGALAGVLEKSDMVELQFPLPLANYCVVRFPFLKSDYKIAIEQIPGTEREDKPK